MCKTNHIPLGFLFTHAVARNMNPAHAPDVMLRTATSTDTKSDPAVLIRWNLHAYATRTVAEPDTVNGNIVSNPEVLDCVVPTGSVRILYATELSAGASAVSGNIPVSVVFTTLSLSRRLFGLGLPKSIRKEATMSCMMLLTAGNADSEITGELKAVSGWAAEYCMALWLLKRAVAATML